MVQANSIDRQYVSHYFLTTHRLYKQEKEECTKYKDAQVARD